MGIEAPRPHEKRDERRVPEETSPPRDDVKVGSSALRCPFCHDTVALEKAWMACESCLARHHAPCWNEGKGCSTCGKKRGLPGGALKILRAPAPAPVQQPFVISRRTALGIAAVVLVGALAWHEVSLIQSTKPRPPALPVAKAQVVLRLSSEPIDRQALEGELARLAHACESAGDEADAKRVEALVNDLPPKPDGRALLAKLNLGPGK